VETDNRREAASRAAHRGEARVAALAREAIGGCILAASIEGLGVSKSEMVRGVVSQKRIVAVVAEPCQADA